MYFLSQILESPVQQMFCALRGTITSSIANTRRLDFPPLTPAELDRVELMRLSAACLRIPLVLLYIAYISISTLVMLESF